MLIYKSLPFCCSASGPEEVDGIGNFYLHVLAPAPSQFPVVTLYFFDSHGELPRKAPFYRKEYDCIKLTQTRWFRESSQANRKAREQYNDGTPFHQSLAFLHIPIPKFADDSKLQIGSGRRREPTEGSSDDSGLYDALVEEGTQAVGAGHDHGNDTAAQPRQAQPSDARRLPWLLYPGAVGFGAYGSYAGSLFHRRARVYHFTTGRLATWLHVQHQENPVDNLLLVDKGEIVGPPESVGGLPKESAESRTCVMS